MRYANVYDFDVVNGNNIGISIFFQGCKHQCKGCFNQETWDFNSGKEWTKSIENEIVNITNNTDYISRLSILGGEPLQQPLSELKEFLSKINKPIYIWSGYTWEEIIRDKDKFNVVKQCDYLIDGKFIEEEKDLTLWLRGSRNQRVINIKKTIQKNELVLEDM